MRKKPLVRLGIVAASVAWCTVAGADGSPDIGSPRIEIGIRSGYSGPYGAADSNESLGDPRSIPDLSAYYTSRVALMLDIGLRMSPNFYVGLTGAYGLLGFGTSHDPQFCDEGEVNSSGHDWQLGVEGQYHILPWRLFDPWIGIGTGYEWAGLSVSGNCHYDVGESGFQFFNVQAGADYKVTPNVGLGPFLMFSVGEYTNGSRTLPGELVQNKTPHEWLTFGIRGVFDIKP
jgi:outer membrane protein W